MTSCQQLANASALTGPLLRAFVALCMFSSASAFASQIQGQVQGANAPIGGATVTLWAASADAPRQLAQTQSDAGGRFTLSADDNGVDLYLVAKGGRAAAGKVNGNNPALAMIAVLGAAPTANVVTNEMTTVASVWTHNQFLNGTVVKGSALSRDEPRARRRIVAATARHPLVKSWRRGRSARSPRPVRRFGDWEIDRRWYC